MMPDGPTGLPVVRPLLKKKPLQGLNPTTALRLKMSAGAETSRWSQPTKLPDSSRPYREQNVWTKPAPCVQSKANSTNNNVHSLSLVCNPLENPGCAVLHKSEKRLSWPPLLKGLIHRGSSSPPKKFFVVCTAAEDNWSKSWSSL